MNQLKVNAEAVYESFLQHVKDHKQEMVFDLILLMERQFCGEVGAEMKLHFGKPKKGEVYMRIDSRQQWNMENLEKVG